MPASEMPIPVSVVLIAIVSSCTMNTLTVIRPAKREKAHTQYGSPGPATERDMLINGKCCHAPGMARHGAYRSK